MKEKRLMKKIGEVLSKERETISAATIRKEEIGKDSANRRKLRILIETCLSIVYEYSKEEKEEERQQQNGWRCRWYEERRRRRKKYEHSDSLGRPHCFHGRRARFIRRA